MVGHCKGGVRQRGAIKNLEKLTTLALSATQILGGLLGWRVELAGMSSWSAEENYGPKRRFNFLRDVIVTMKEGEG